MRHFFSKIWNTVSYIGLSPDSDHPDKQNIVLGNQVVLILTLTLTGLCAAFMVAGLWEATLLIGLMVVLFIGLTYLIYRQYFLLGRLLGFMAQCINIFLQAILLGYETRIIDFLLISALLPLVLFHIRQRKIIFFTIAFNFALYIVYHLTRSYWEAQTLPLDQQLLIYYLTMPVKFILVLMVFYIVRKNRLTFESQLTHQNSELLQQKNYFTSIIDQIPIHIVTVDRHFKYTYANKHSMRDDTMRQWLIGKDDFEYVHFRQLDPAIAEQRQVLFRQAFDTQGYVEMEEEMIDRFGKKVVSLKAVHPIRNEAGEVSELVGYSIDITDRKATEEKLKRVVRELEDVNAGLRQFAYVTSHDLKTPLRNISTYLQLIKRKNQLDDDSSRMIDSAVKSVKHLNQLITDIFLYTTNEFKDETIEEVDLKQVIETIRNDIEAIVDEKQGKLIIPETLPVLRMNRTQVIHIFSNLISNALKYNKHEKPEIIISYTPQGNLGELRVSDNGIGIEPVYHEQIFEIFKRLHTQEEYEGTGIGLAICKKIIESYGGTIRVESEPGHGASFVFTLPVA